MIVVNSFEDVRRLLSGRVGLVPTMGYLHEGHCGLIEAAAKRCDTVVVSVFVNPLQFDNTEDLETYPADLERDSELADRAGADVIFAPRGRDMYPTKQRTSVSVAEVGDAMEGLHRPGHFKGVATVVAKLFAGVQPDVAFFGRKDAQQLAVVTALANELAMPVDVVGLPIVREQDGLALSSRNTRLSTNARVDALMLSQSLFGAGELFASGERSSSVLTSSVRDILGSVSTISLDYVEVADAASAAIVAHVTGLAFLSLAARVGGVRLIDNIYLDGAAGTVDAGTRLRHRSILYGGGRCS